MAVGAAQAEEDRISSPATNLQRFQSLSEEVADTLCTFIPEGDSVTVVLEPKESIWFVQGGILRTISGRGRFPTQSLASPFEISLGVLKFEVKYADVRRSGFLGPKIVDRTVSTRFAATVINKMEGTILFTNELQRIVKDTVEFSEISQLENSGIAATHGTLPGEGFFSTLIEPIVTIGALAVGVYLLFHVRTQ